MMILKRFFLLGSLCGMMAAAVAHADTITTYTLSVNGCSSGCGTGPYGTVTVDTATSGLSATVTVSLFSNVNFAGTGAGNALAFDLAGTPSVTFSGVTAGFGPVGPASASTFGSFDYAVSCWDHSVTGGACHGSTGPTSLSFTITSSSPILFVKNAPTNGFFFASDVAVTTDGVVATGNVGDRDPGTTTSTPEPSSLMLLGTGVMGLAGFVRRRMA